jgi:hypothetical protein
MLTITRCPPRVVQVGQAIGQTRTQMQQRGGGLSCHATVAVGCASDHAFEQAKDGAHAIHRIERRHEMHLRRARIAKTHLHATRHQRAQQTFRTVHA